jgi:hypothetical protein
MKLKKAENDNIHILDDSDVFVRSLSQNLRVDGLDTKTVDGGVIIAFGNKNDAPADLFRKVEFTELIRKGGEIIDPSSLTLEQFALELDDNFFRSNRSILIEDETTPPVIAFFTQSKALTSLANPASIGDTDVEVVSATGLVVGQHFTIFNIDSQRFYFSKILVIASTTISLDTPLDFAFPAGSFVDAGIEDMSVDGSSTTQIFALRGGGQGIEIEFDCTRIIIQCKTATAGTLAEFGDLAALVKGLVFRRIDGEFKNIFNVKTNGDIANIAFDFEFFTAAGQGQDGFAARLTFAGQNKMGTTLRIGPGEDLQMLVQDNLVGLDDLTIIAEGSLVNPN